MFLRTVLVIALLNATTHAQPAITASDAWIAEPRAGATTAAAYLSISNPTMYDIYVVSATSEAAGKIELREGDTPVKEIIVASFGSAELKPGGPHVMLMDLKRPLKAGETIEIVLATDSGIILKVPAPVKMIVSPL